MCDSSGTEDETLDDGKDRDDAGQEAGCLRQTEDLLFACIFFYIIVGLCVCVCRERP